ncbi:MAG: Gfo/Idh/MocA family oxidoreductase, partial [Candidatus Korobacteraceae bacterium]
MCLPFSFGPTPAQGTTFGIFEGFQRPVAFRDFYSVISMNSWKRKLRMGMVGGGQGAFIGAVHRLVAALDGQVELAAGVFSRDPQNSRATGAQLYLDPARIYSSYEAMAASETKLPPDKRIDFVSIVTPNNAHFGPAKAFLEAGIHVICDKPLAFTIEEAEELERIVERTGLVFALTHNYTGYPMVRHARQLFQSGEMGTVRKVIVEYLQDWLMDAEEVRGSKQAAWRTNPAESGIGGAIGDIGTHAINLAEYVTNDPVVEICADKTIFVPGRKLDDDCNALLRLQGGGKGLFTVSQVATGQENGLRLRVYGSKGSILWAQEDPNYLHVWRHGKPRETLSRGRSEYLSPEVMAISRTPWGHPEGYLEAFANIYVGAVEAIRRHIDGKPMTTAEYAFPTVYDGVRGMLFIYAVVESADKGAVWVQMQNTSARTETAK